MILERGFHMVSAKVVLIDHNTDIAILVPEERLRYTKPIPFRRDIVNQVGERVYHTGHPAREGWHISEGILSGAQNDVLLINTFAWPGSSGSVVFDESGRVIGVLSSIRMDGPFGIPELIEHIALAGNIKTLSPQTLKSVLSDGSN
jgi:S1-C subfamily serine protease